jgi:hypothetical protein
VDHLEPLALPNLLFLLTRLKHHTSKLSLCIIDGTQRFLLRRLRRLDKSSGWNALNGLVGRYELWKNPSDTRSHFLGVAGGLRIRKTITLHTIADQLYDENCKTLKSANRSSIYGYPRGMIMCCCCMCRLRMMILQKI